MKLSTSASRRVARSTLIAVPVLAMASWLVQPTLARGTARYWPAGPGVAAVRGTRDLPPGSLDSSQLRAISCPDSTACVAVGGSYSAAAWNGSSWRPLPAALIPRGYSLGRTLLTAVSCPRAAECVVTGQTRALRAHARRSGLAEVWNGSSWRILPAPPVIPAAVSCLSARRCVVIGRAIAASWNGTRWATARLPLPPGARGGALTGLSCPSARACLAVGTYRTATQALSLADIWNGRAWRASSAPGTGLKVVSCPSAAQCVATAGTLSAIWNAGGWSSAAVPVAAGQGISCPAVNDCVAIGALHFSPNPGTAASWNGSAWSAETVPEPPTQFGAPVPQPLAISCPASDKCVMVGGGGLLRVSVGWLRSGTTWSLVRLGRDEVLDSVSCPGRARCFATGTYLSRADAFEAVFEESPGLGGPWTAVTAPPLHGQFDGARTPVVISCPSASQCQAAASGGPTAATWIFGLWTADFPGLPFHTPLGITCPDSSMCLAVGGQDTPPFTPVAAQWLATSGWQAISLPLPHNSTAYLSGVSCAGSSWCMAVGASVKFGPAITSANLAELWNGTSWRQVAVPQQSGYSYLRAVSCAAPTFCLAVGQHSASAGVAPGPFSEIWTGKVWRASALPRAAGAGAVLAGVSCASASSCVVVGYRDVLAFPPLPDVARPLAFAWSKSAWRVITPPFAHGGFASVFCARAADCVAVGQAGPALGMAERWNGRSWKRLHVASP